MKIGYNTWAIPRLPYGTFLPELRRIGYTAVALTVVPGYTINGEWVRNATDIDLLDAAERERIGAQCNELGMELHSVVGNQNIIGGDAGQTQVAMQRLRDTRHEAGSLTARQQWAPSSLRSLAPPDESGHLSGAALNLPGIFVCRRSTVGVPGKSRRFR